MQRFGFRKSAVSFGGISVSASGERSFPAPVPQLLTYSAVSLIHTYMHTRIATHVYIYIYIQAYTYAHLSIYLCIYLSIYLSIYPSVHLSIPIYL